MTLPFATRHEAARGGMPDVALAALAPMVWGATYLVTTQLLPGFPPIGVAAMRALPAGILLLLVCRQLPTGIWLLRSLVLGALNFSVFWALLFQAAYRLPGGIAATIGAVQPMIVILAAGLVLGNKIRAVSLVAASFGLVGVGLLVLQPEADWIRWEFFRLWAGPFQWRWAQCFLVAGSHQWRHWCSPAGNSPQEVFCCCRSPFWLNRCRNPSRQPTGPARSFSCCPRLSLTSCGSADLRASSLPRFPPWASSARSRQPCWDGSSSPRHCRHCSCLAQRRSSPASCGANGQGNRPAGLGVAFPTGPCS